MVHFDLATRGAVWVAAREQMGAEHVRDAFPAFYDLFEWIAQQNLGVTARKLDQHCKALHRDWSSTQDAAAIVRLLVEARLLSLLHSAALLSHIPSLPVEAFDPSKYLRGLVGRSRHGRPLAADRVLAAYVLAAKGEEAGADTPWHEDPGFVLVSALSALKHAERERYRDRAIPMSPPGLTPVCIYCWRDADLITARCTEHARLRRQPSERLAFENWRRGLAAMVRKLEPDLRQSDRFEKFGKLVEQAEREWEAERRRYLIERTDDAKAKFDSATVAYEMLVRTRRIELSPAAIHRVAHDLALRKVRRRHLAIGYLLSGDDSPSTYANAGRSLGLTRQAVWSARHAAARAKTVADEIIANAIPMPTPNEPKHAYQRVDLQRLALTAALRRLAASDVEH